MPFMVVFDGTNPVQVGIFFTDAEKVLLKP